MSELMLRRWVMEYPATGREPGASSAPCHERRVFDSSAHAEADLFDSLADLKSEQATLWARAQNGTIRDAERSRLRAIEREVEECWQRLRLRRSRRRTAAHSTVAVRVGRYCAGTVVRHLDGVPVRCSMATDCVGLDRPHVNTLHCDDVTDTCDHCVAIERRRVG